MHENNTSRVLIDDTFSAQEIRALIADESTKYIQFNTPLPTSTLVLLNDELFSIRPEIQLRCFGGYKDLSFVKYLPNVTKFSADGLRRDIENIDALSSLTKLKELHIGIWELEDLDFLNQVPASLTYLGIDQTKSAKLDLAVLSRFTNLNELYLEKQTKNIDVIGQLQKLEKLTLRSITTENIAYLLPHKKTLRSLDIKLGGLSDLSELEGFTALSYLELWQIRGLTDIGFISSLAGLERMKLESLRHITSLPALDKLQRLARVELINMKGLRDIRSLADAPALSSFSHWSAQNMQPSDYEPLLNNRAVKQVSVGFGSKRKNEEFVALAESKGKTATL